MYAVIEASSDRRAPKSTTHYELDRFMSRDDAMAYIESLVNAGRYGTDTAHACWVTRVTGAGEEQTGRFRVARDGRSFVQIGRLCVWGKKGETESSLRARKDEQIEG